MAAFRDDRQALLERLRALEQELARPDPGRGQVRAEIEELRRKVSEATAALEEDRRGLDEIARALERLASAVNAPATAGRQASWPRISLVVGALGGVLFLLILAAVCGGERRSVPADRALELARQLPGFPHRVDPVALLPAVRRAAATSLPLRLISMKARYAGPQGLVDLDGPGYQGSVEYRFQEEAPPPTPVPAGPKPPLGVPRTERPIFTTDWSMSLDRNGLNVSHQLFMPGFFKAVPDPSCSVKQVWEAALDAGAPAHAVARLEYQRAIGGQAAWSFEIDGTGFRIEVSDPGCRRRTDSLNVVLPPATGRAVPVEQPAAPE